MEQDDEVEEEVLEQDYPNVTLFILLKLPLDDVDVNRIQEFIFYAHTHPTVLLNLVVFIFYTHKMLIKNVLFKLQPYFLCKCNSA